MAATDQMNLDRTAAGVGTPAPTWQLALAVGLFFTSGFLALALEICWIRKASLVFGTASFALSTVLAVFFGGLAIGSYVFGRRASKIQRPLRMYAGVECGVGLLALLSPWAFNAADGLYEQAYPALLDNFALLSATRIGLVAVILLPPTVLMGATLPLFCRYFVQRENRIARSVGLLYGANTLGAAIGCAVCGFLMIRYIGVNRSIYLCGTVNILVGLLAWRLPAAKQSGDACLNVREERPGVPPTDRAKTPGAHVLLIPCLFFCAGFIALGNEVLWTRFLSLLMHNTVYTYTLTLTVVLLGIVVGSVLTSWWGDRSRRRGLVFGAVQVATGWSVMLVLMLPASWWSRWSDPESLLSQFAIVMVVLLVPAILSGIAFPLAIRMVVDDPAQAARVVGRMTALNTLGGICGAMSVGFVILPLWGMETTLWLTTALSIACGLAAWIWLERSIALWKRLVLIVSSVCVWLAIPISTGTSLPSSYLANGGRLIDYREGIGSQVAVTRREAVLRLEIDRLWQGEARKTHQIMAAHVPMILHRDPQSALVVGIGPGQTAQRFLMYPSLLTLDCVDIERELLPLIRAYFEGDWLDDPRVRIIVEDGRNYATHTNKKYDVISIEVGQAFRPGVASFYTAEFYGRLRERLEPGGLVSQFAPLGFFSHQTDEFRTVIQTFLSVFPNSVLWYNDRECLLIGSNQEPPSLLPERLELIKNHGPIHDDLKYSPWGGPEFWANRQDVFLSGFLMGPRSLANLAGDALIYHDDRPYLEYTTNPHFSAAELPVLKLINAHLEPLRVVYGNDLDRAANDDVAKLRQLNLRDIAAAASTAKIHAQLAKGDFAAADRWMTESLRQNPYRVRSYSTQGIALLQQERIADAMTAFLNGLQQDPNDFSCLWGLGRAHLSQRAYADAASHLLEAVAARPDYAEPRLHLAQAYRGSKRPDKAIEAYREAVALDREHAQAHAELGALLAGRGQTREAITNLEAAVRLAPDFALGHLYLASALEANDQPRRAVDHFRSAIDLAHDLPPAYNGLAWLLATHPDESIRALGNAVSYAEHAVDQTNGTNASILDTLAAAYASNGRFEEAVSTARNALRLATNENNDRLATEIRQRLQQYEQSMPYRETHSPPSGVKSPM